MRTFKHTTVKVRNSAGEFEGLPALRGQSAYELAVQNGYEGSEADWIKDSLGDGWIPAFQGLSAKVDGMTASYTATIPAEWGEDVPHTVAINVPGIKASDMPHITPVYSTSLETAIAEKAAWCCVSTAEAMADSIVFYCFEDKPTIPINIQIKVVR